MATEVKFEGMEAEFQIGPVKVTIRQTPKPEEKAPTKEKPGDQHD